MATNQPDSMMCGATATVAADSSAKSGLKPVQLQDWPAAEARLEGAYPGPHYVLFTASTDEQGVPWCPDCARALPAVRYLVCVSLSCYLLRVPVLLVSFSELPATNITTFMNKFFVH